MNPGVKIQTPLGIGDVGQLVAAEQAGSNYINSSKKVLQFKFDLLYITLFSVFSTKIGIIRKLV